MLVGFLVEKIMYVDFWVENLRPFSLDHSVSLSRVCSIFCAAILRSECWHQKAPSSQNRLFVVSVQLANILFMAIRKSITLRILPCGRPFSSLCLFDRKLLILTWIVLFFRKFWTNIGMRHTSIVKCWHLRYNHVNLPQNWFHKITLGDKK